MHRSGSGARLLPPKLIAGLGALAACLAGFGADAATFAVTSTGDSGTGTLRQAILDANAAGPGPNTIGFSGCTGNCDILLASQLPPITSGMTIDGSTAPVGTATIDGQSSVPAFFVDTGTVTLANLVIQNVKATGGAEQGGELLEMRYLWREPLRLDNRKLIGLLGTEPHTPLDEAIRRTLIGLDCLPIEDENAATRAELAASTK